MITLTCPDCSEQYELDDEMAGKKAACKCGAVLFVPATPDIPEGKKLCPSCSTISDEATVLCISCGYNFETGGRIRSAESRIKEKEEDARITALRRFWKPITLFIILCLIGMVVYNSLFAKHYGISSSDPMGSLTAIKKHLAKANYEIQPASENKLPKVFGNGAKKIEWKDAKLAISSQGMYIEKVFVITSSDNKILAVGANFKGGVKTIPGDTGSRSGRFMTSLWKDAGFKYPPVYKEVKKGSGRWVYTYNRANVEINEIRGEWIEYPEEISILPSQHTMIITYKKYPELTYDKIQNPQTPDFDIKQLEEIKPEEKDKKQ